jgi:hypothetical protein
MHERDDGTPYPFEYQAINGFEAICEIRLYRHVGKTVVVATDLDVGPSVTNNVERIATLLRQQDITFDLFCEHYFDRGEETPRGDETFDWVEFTWSGETAIHATWKPGSREQVESLIGRRFE